METTQVAAERVGVNVQKFHRLVAEHGIQPALKAPGLRGAMFWSVDDVDRLIDALAAERAEATS